MSMNFSRRYCDVCGRYTWHDGPSCQSMDHVDIVNDMEIEELLGTSCKELVGLIVTADEADKLEELIQDEQMEYIKRELMVSPTRFMFIIKDRDYFQSDAPFEDIRYGMTQNV